ncbi:MAG: hypothetical protein IJN59_03400 [Oscillospiraceae bacterium]|nr:hypothetical protein [Oscillospiraceae bacterium]
MNKPTYNESNIKTDCFGYCRIDAATPPKCTALDGLYCATGNCNFYKPKAQQEAMVKKYGGPKNAHLKSTI